MRDNRTLRSEIDSDSDVDELLICDEHAAKLIDILWTAVAMVIGYLAEATARRRTLDITAANTSIISLSHISAVH